ncbi:MAG: RNHCP domain-containing protein [Clostridia bacterium]|nr:RNHCP domain-containing protein [Clostridia bacterium]
MKTFEKNDNEFMCRVCGKSVPTLIYSSRDHCNKCLCSVHIDINPGDRANTCLGTLIPVEVNINNNKGYVITYKCNKCGKFHNNKTAEDDNFKTLLKVMNRTYNIEDYKI